VETIGIGVMFLVMLAAPCAVAFRSSQKSDEADAADAMDPKGLVAEMAWAEGLDHPLTLAEMAARAEGDALIAQEIAREAQHAALEAAAYAARLRADAAIEAARSAELAIRAVQSDYLPGDHPSLDFPRSRVRRRAA
jgi:hypothetical protein